MSIDIRFYRKMALRRLPAMTVLFLLCAGVGVILAIKLPTTYASSARLLVESQQIPGELATSTVSTDTPEQLEIIRQRLMTRANLIDVANKLNVFPASDGLTPDDVFRRMRSATSVKTSGRPIVVSISFEAGTPRAATAVVNEFVTFILSANAEFRTGAVDDTRDFFEQEVNNLNRELELQSERILAFKNANANALPDNLEYRLNRQSTLQARLTRAERERAILLEQRQRIETLYETTGRVTQEQNNLSPEERQLGQLETELNNALLVYSATSPRVRVLQTRVEQLTEIVRAQKGAGAATNEADTQASLFEITIAEVDGKIAELETELTKLQQDLDDLAASIRATPQNDIALQSLERDYSNVRGQYNSAVSRLAQARMGERIELGSKGQRISVVEPASTPRSPSSPNRPIIAGGGIAAGIAAAVGLFLLLEMINTSVRRPVEITNKLGITPLAAIPHIESKQRRLLRIFTFGFLLLAALVGVTVLLWGIDQHYMPLDILFQRIITRLGLG
ncbi:MULTISPECIES: lipopolysaccharide biosynthesis [Rhodobacterales]|uniref:GumC family protein n=1 Tax=Rhodobacterales TaxID=204455 RepID=UPI003297669E